MKECILHCGIYVSNLSKMTEFYEKVFDMQVVCSEQEDSAFFLDKLLGITNARILVTKLITPRGKCTRIGDMIELIQIISSEDVQEFCSEKRICSKGVIHIAMQCANIEKTVKDIIALGGKIIVTPIKRDNGNWLCFAQDPEGNFLELIQRK